MCSDHGSDDVLKMSCRMPGSTYTYSVPLVNVSGVVSIRRGDMTSYESDYEMSEDESWWEESEVTVS